MSSTRIDEEGFLKLPEDVRQALGLQPGDLLRFRIEDGKVWLEPTEEEAEVDLSEALEDVRAGRVQGPFESARELFHHLNR